MIETAIPGARWFADEVATFGDRLATARETARLTQDELARRLGVKPKTVRAWENDQSTPRANKLQMVAGLLNVSITWLLTAQGDGPDGPDGADTPALPEPVGALLLELRGLRTEQAQLANRMGQLEKRLRGALRGPREQDQILDDRTIRIRRLKMRATQRGIREMDLILGSWARAHLAHASEADLDVFEAVLAEADHDLYQWVTGQVPAPAHYAAFMEHLARSARRAGAWSARVGV